jgi:hypothetical protein
MVGNPSRTEPSLNGIESIVTYPVLRQPDADATHTARASDSRLLSDSWYSIGHFLSFVYPPRDDPPQSKNANADIPESSPTSHSQNLLVLMVTSSLAGDYTNAAIITLLAITSATLSTSRRQPPHCLSVGQNCLGLDSSTPRLSSRRSSEADRARGFPSTS